MRRRCQNKKKVMAESFDEDFALGDEDSMNEDYV